MLISVYLIYNYLNSPIRFKAYPSTMAEVECNSIARIIKHYYSSIDPNVDIPNKPDLMKHIEDIYNMYNQINFSYTVPIEPYTSIRDFGVYLQLPETLNSDSRTLVAYTTTICDKKNKYYRRIFVYFVNNDIDVEKSDLLGSQDINEPNDIKPDFYHWHRKKEYLEDLKKQQ